MGCYNLWYLSQVRLVESKFCTCEDGVDSFQAVHRTLSNVDLNLLFDFVDSFFNRLDASLSVLENLSSVLVALIFPSTLLDHTLFISTPMRNIVVISHEFRRCPLRVGDNIRSANLLPLEMSDFDIILGLPPEREVEFTIELISGAQPISKAPVLSKICGRVFTSCFTFDKTYAERREVCGYQIYSDASKKGLGCVLMEHGRYRLCIRKTENIISVLSDIMPWKLNMRQRRWLELLKDYDTNIQYHPGKTNVVANALSRKNSEIMALRTKESQKEDGELWSVLENLIEGKQVEFQVDDYDVIWYDNRLCVPGDSSLQEAILTETHNSPLCIHLGSIKMYRDLKQNFWWNGIKHDVARFVAKCLTCQQVKIEHQHASGLSLASRYYDLEVGSNLHGLCNRVALHL
ncbi:retrotransposon protein, putative, ty3-gypsy subclass [Tanacetum coccineum]